MNSWQAVLAIAAILMALVVRSDRRALIWIACGALSFAASTAYQRSGFEHWPVFTALCDACLCLAIYFFGRLQWELILWRVWQTSVLISILFVYDLIPSRYGYVVALEAANWAALVVIGTASAAKALDHGIRGRSGRFVRVVRGAVRAVHSQRTHASWWRQ